MTPKRIETHWTALARWLVLALFIAMPALALPQHEPPRPNVLMIIVDDMNDWIGAMGGHPDTSTPNMDRLASQGTLFTNMRTPRFAALLAPA